jgi:hypothetical protein
MLAALVPKRKTRFVELHIDRDTVLSLDADQLHDAHAALVYWLAVNRPGPQSHNRGVTCPEVLRRLRELELIRDRLAALRKKGGAW